MGVIFDEGLSQTPQKGSCPALHLPAYDGWDGLALEYSLAWPLHLLLTPDVMAQYGALFRFLLRLKRASAELDAAWTALRGLDRSPDPGLDPNHSLSGSRRILWHLRHRMAHLVGNLLVYMQVGCPAPLHPRQAPLASLAKTYSNLWPSHCLGGTLQDSGRVASSQ